MQKVKYFALIFKPIMKMINYTLIGLMVILILVVVTGSALGANYGNSTAEDAAEADLDNYMAGIILSGVFVIFGGILTVIVRRDISKRNLHLTKWMVLLILFMIVIPVIETFLILTCGINSFYSFILLGTNYVGFFAIYIYFRAQSVLLVRNVPTELVVKLSSAYREILAFGILIFGLLITVIGIYQIKTGEGDVGKPVAAVGIGTSIIGLVMIRMWFKWDNIVINTREIKIKRGNKVETLSWGDVESIMFYKELSHLLNINVGGYRKRMGTAGSQKVVEIIGGNKRLKFMDGEIPSYEDFRILFFILLHHRERSNQETKVYFHSKWAKTWYRDYRRHIMQSR